LPDSLEFGGFGLYLHWPFCQAKCPYCDFNSHVVSSVDQTRWAAAFEKEIDRIAEMTGDRVLNSVFFGGGTPSLMDVSTVDRMMARIQKRWKLANDFEVTLEANPTSIEAQRFVGYFAAGVNRVSVGVQALNDSDLKALGRLHSADEALAAVELARTTFDRVNFDLIYARQNQSVGQWQAELTRALNLEPDHLSLYQLTVEDGTAFGDRFKRGLLRGLPNEDLGADLWNVTQDACEKAGLPAYEVSNHAKVGQESRHNLVYWRSGDWAGIGPGAHGRLTLDGVRRETVCVKSPGMWIKQVECGALDRDTGSALGSSDILEERVLMGLRMVEGVEMPSKWMTDNFNKIKELVLIGQLETTKNRLTVTAQGRPVLNAVISHLLTD
jgi:putative oxygen-independent coproporphyrinogen III oxidase